MRHLLGLLERNDSVIVSHHWRQQLETPQTASLWKATTSLKKVPCPYCPHIHPIRMRHPDKRYIFTCDITGATQAVSSSTLRRWQLHVPSLLSHLARQLRIHPKVAKLHPSSIWRLGLTDVAGTKEILECWLCVRLSPSALHWLLDHLKEADNRIVLLMLRPASLLRRIQPAQSSLDLSLLVRDSLRLRFDAKYFQQWITRRYQRVYFELENGDLWVDGKRLLTNTPASPQFYFAQCLWENFNHPISHEDIFDYCTRKLAARDGVEKWQSEYLPGAFCHTMKRLIKKSSSLPELCDQVFVSTRTHGEENAFRLTCSR